MSWLADAFKDAGSDDNDEEMEQIEQRDPSDRRPRMLRRVQSRATRRKHANGMF